MPLACQPVSSHYQISGLTGRRLMDWSDFSFSKNQTKKLNLCVLGAFAVNK